MDHLTLIKSHFQNERKSLLKAIEATKKTRDDAPSAMESHSDTTRSQSERMVFALEENLEKINKFIDIIPDAIDKKESLWRGYNVKFKGKRYKIILVPEGMGGRKVYNYTLVSKESPLAQKLLNKLKKVK